MKTNNKVFLLVPLLGLCNLCFPQQGGENKVPQINIHHTEKIEIDFKTRMRDTCNILKKNEKNQNKTYQNNKSFVISEDSLS